MLGIPFLESHFFSLFAPSTYDDRIDRLHYFVTSSLLTFFAIIVSAKQYVGSPIQCWMPMEFKGGWEQYAEDYCFIQNTYWIHFNEPLPEDFHDRRGAEIGYYQWVPIVMALQALMFYVPSWLWKTLNKQSGLNMDVIIKEAKSIRGARTDDRKGELIKLATFVEDSLSFESPTAHRRLLCFNFGRSLGSYVSSLYVLVKFAYLINIILQFVILNNFLGTEQYLWGIQSLMDLTSGREWTESGIFPRVTMCDFKVRRLGNIHRYSIQCVLMVNMFNEKIYLFLWFWFLFVAVSTVINFIYYFLSIVGWSWRETSIKNLLSTIDLNDSCRSDTKIIRRFVHSVLRPDGVLLLRFVDTFAGGIVARDLCAQLFINYCNAERQRYGMLQKCNAEKSPSICAEEGCKIPYTPQKATDSLLEPDSAYTSPPTVREE